MVWHTGTTVGGQPQQLGEKERVAAGALVQRGELVGAQRRPLAGGQRRLGGAQAVQLDEFDVAAEVDDQSMQCSVGGQLGVAVGPDQQQWHGVQGGGEEAQESQ